MAVKSHRGGPLLAGKRAVISGAGSGIGLQAAVTFAREGARRHPGRRRGGRSLGR
jgi:NAD(P)-dependent dehydrogenase (short-subunit alcohol dehydrogenase family)